MFRPTAQFKRTKALSGGFTLVEMLVSVALFTIVMTIGLSVILSVVDGNKKTQSINSVVNNLNSSIDSMVRDMKTGIEYRCNHDGNDHLPITKGNASDCTNSSESSPSISFISTITGTERSVKYEYVPPNETSGVVGYISKVTCPPPLQGPCSDPIRITSPEINVTDMRMYVKAGINGQYQPGILLVIGGTARINPTTVSNFYIQTFVSRRVLNI
jgi:prepilin-type N-terminal cleavage/methylation domain-containing protein